VFLKKCAYTKYVKKCCGKRTFIPSAIDPWGKNEEKERERERERRLLN
jgi:hypothetical protein